MCPAADLIGLLVRDYKEVHHEVAPYSNSTLLCSGPLWAERRRKAPMRTYDVRLILNLVAVSRVGEGNPCARAPARCGQPLPLLRSSFLEHRSRTKSAFRWKARSNSNKSARYRKMTPTSPPPKLIRALPMAATVVRRHHTGWSARTSAGRTSAWRTSAGRTIGQVQTASARILKE
jgi:hypothetical protein